MCLLAVIKGIWVRAASACNRVMRTLSSTCWHPVGLTTARWFAVDTASVSVASVCVAAITVGNSANVMTIVVNTIMAFSAMVRPVDWHKNFAFSFCLFLNFRFKTHYLLLCAFVIGNGRCVCGTCQCSDYTGSACECSPSQDKCMNDKGLCSSQGKCTCNRCQCYEGFKGEHCSAFTDECTRLK